MHKPLMAVISSHLPRDQKPIGSAITAVAYSMGHPVFSGNNSTRARPRAYHASDHFKIGKGFD
jgi:hypothetical protein